MPTALARRPRRPAPPDPRDIIRIEADCLTSPRMPPTDHAQQRMIASVARFGVMHPILVRAEQSPRALRFRVIDGCRRLYAAIACGITVLPCVLEAEDDDTADFAEQYHRLADDCFAQADLLAERLAQSGETQQALADRLGLSQSAVANKLRLRRLTPEQRQCVLDHHLTERHARALVSAPPEVREALLRQVTDGALTVAQTEALIEAVTASPPDEPPRWQKAAIRDIGLFYNSIDRAVSILHSVGIPATVSRTEARDAITMSICIPRNVSRETSPPDTEE